MAAMTTKASRLMLVKKRASLKSVLPAELVIS
jgi:hypothetical protein